MFACDTDDIGRPDLGAAVVRDRLEAYITAIVARGV
jgi:hypothetical protein